MLDKPGTVFVGHLFNFHADQIASVSCALVELFIADRRDDDLHGAGRVFERESKCGISAGEVAFADPYGGEDKCETG